MSRLTIDMTDKSHSGINLRRDKQRDRLILLYFAEQLSQPNH